MSPCEAVRFVFSGSLSSDSFIDFARHRAARLDVKLAFGSCRDGRIELTIRGPAALVDAFEMACSLGPEDCIVQNVRRLGGSED